MLPRGAKCCSLPARCSPGRICRDWPTRKGRDPRFLAIILRGALDGLATVAPVGDPDWVALRGDNALTFDGKVPPLKLNDFFALNPAMPNLHRMFQSNEAIIVHACATPYRERSHFDGQDLLESGLPKPAPSDSGWLNRALSASGARRPGRSQRQQGFCRRSGDAACRARPGAGAVVVAAADHAGERRYCWRGCSNSIAIPIRSLPACSRTVPSSRPSSMRATWRKSRAARLQPRCAPISAEAAGNAAKFLAQPDGPRVGALALDGWDTHVNEGIATGRLSQLLGALDDALAAVKTNMGAGMEGYRRGRSPPSSAAPPISTAPTAPITAPRRWRCSSAARSRAAASSPIGRD